MQFVFFTPVGKEFARRYHYTAIYHTDLGGMSQTAVLTLFGIHSTK